MNAIAQVWIFPSSSGRGTYETLRYTDGTTSCNCPGWTRRTAPDGSRSCKHTRSVDLGRANHEADSFHDYSVPATPHTFTVATPKPITLGSNRRKLSL